MPIIGGHVSASVALDLSIDRAQKIGAKCTQIFISPPQQWAQTNHPEEDIKSYREKAMSSGIGPNFIHANYLINLAAANPEHLEKSLNWLRYSLDTADKLGVYGTVVHIGSYAGRDLTEALNQITKSLSKLLKLTPKSSLVMENTAGSGKSIGSRFEDLGTIIKAVNNPKLKICLDTQHAFGSGYDLSTQIGLDKLLLDIDKHVGLANLAVIHCNDSKVACGSNKDRHENIGEGLIGKEGFRRLLNYPDLKNLPFILEVPGFSDTGPDKQNIDILKSLLN